MAKGDGMSGGTAMGMQQPKQDQYSVMHKIFDHLSPQKNSGIAPSGIGFNPNQGMGGAIAPSPMGMNPQLGYNPGMGMGGSIGSPMDNSQQNGPMAPDISQILSQLFQTKPVSRTMG